jgi:hypothetical protein
VALSRIPGGRTAPFMPTLPFKRQLFFKTLSAILKQDILNALFPFTWRQDGSIFDEINNALF